MDIEYFIITKDNSTTKTDVLEIFAPYWTEVEENYYLLDYGTENIQSISVHNQCHFYIEFHTDSSTIVETVIIHKPCGHIELEKAIFQLIYLFPMFVAYPSDPPVVITANLKCAELIKMNDPLLQEHLTTVHSFEEYYDLK